MKSGDVITTLLDFRAHLRIVACAGDHRNDRLKPYYLVKFNMAH
jgi:hypothetical protein